jgi:hypothetical protein
MNRASCGAAPAVMRTAPANHAAEVPWTPHHGKRGAAALAPDRGCSVIDRIDERALPLFISSCNAP